MSSSALSMNTTSLAPWWCATVGSRKVALRLASSTAQMLRRCGTSTVRRWIAEQMQGTSVTVVLVGSHTCKSEWVRHEIQLSEERGNGLLGIDISEIKDLYRASSHRCGRIPRSYPFCFWNRDRGFRTLGSWIETAASVAGR